MLIRHSLNWLLQHQLICAAYRLSCLYLVKVYMYWRLNQAIQTEQVEEMALRAKRGIQDA